MACEIERLSTLAPTMRRYSPPYYSPPRRGYGSRGRSPPRGGYSPPRRGCSPPRRVHGGYRRRKEQKNASLLVRNIPLDTRLEELRVPFERFGLVRDVYIPKDYHTGEPRGFAFVEFVDSYDAGEAQYHMNGQIFAGREISVVVAAETRKRPEDMRRRARVRGPSRHGGRRSPYYRHSRSRSVSHSRSPRYRSGSGGGHQSRSYCRSAGRGGEYSLSPDRRQADNLRSPVDSPQERDARRSYSAAHDDAADGKGTDNGYDEKSKYDAEEARDHRRSSLRRVSRSPLKSRSSSAYASPARST
ncbi:hypothetical protein Ancab_034353 [Ancistrocladus abbreviatus]